MIKSQATPATPSDSRPVSEIAERQIRSQFRLDLTYIHQASSVNPLSVKKSQLVSTSGGGMALLPEVRMQNPQTAGTWLEHTEGEWELGAVTTGESPETRTNNWRYVYTDSFDSNNRMDVLLGCGKIRSSNPFLLSIMDQTFILNSPFWGNRNDFVNLQRVLTRGVGYKSWKHLTGFELEEAPNLNVDFNGLTGDTYILSEPIIIRNPDSGSDSISPNVENMNLNNLWFLESEYWVGILGMSQEPSPTGPANYFQSQITTCGLANFSFADLTSFRSIASNLGNLDDGTFFLEMPNVCSDPGFFPEEGVIVTRSIFQNFNNIYSQLYGTSNRIGRRFFTPDGTRLVSNIFTSDPNANALNPDVWPGVVPNNDVTNVVNFSPTAILNFYAGYFGELNDFRSLGTKLIDTGRFFFTETVSDVGGPIQIESQQTTKQRLVQRITWASAWNRTIVEL
jgi:hypothetical protein